MSAHVLLNSLNELRKNIFELIITRSLINSVIQEHEC